MGQEISKIVRLLTQEVGVVEILTKMPEKEIIAEIEYDAMTEKTPVRDDRWCRFEGLNALDERTPFAIERNLIRSYCILPWHPAQAQAPRGPALIQ